MSKTTTAVFVPQVAILTGGYDRPYALGLATALIAAHVSFDFIGGDFLDSPELHQNPKVRFLNLRGNQSAEAGAAQKVLRVLLYYFRLIAYSATSRAPVFHLLWNNKFESFDRTVLTLYYKLLGKKLVLTVHNVNKAKRDNKDNWFNRLTLRIQYRLLNHLFVHTETMKRELQHDFNVPSSKISVIPFGINSTVPNTTLEAAQARQKLGLRAEDKVLLFYGHIAAYKGLEFLVEALPVLLKTDQSYRLVIAGRPKGEESYWGTIRDRITSTGLDPFVIKRIEFVPDEDTEIYFKAADIFVLPYTHIFQSGVLFLGYNFGLPVVAADVGSLKEDIVEGQTGYVCRPRDSHDLAATITTYFDSDLYRRLPDNRERVRAYATERYSWAKVAAITREIYARVKQRG